MPRRVHAARIAAALNHTADTRAHFQAEAPQWELFFLLGGFKILDDLPRWHGLPRICQLAAAAAVRRAGEPGFGFRAFSQGISATPAKSTRRRRHEVEMPLTYLGNLAPPRGRRPEHPLSGRRGRRSGTSRPAGCIGEGRLQTSTAGATIKHGWNWIGGYSLLSVWPVRHDSHNNWSPIVTRSVSEGPHIELASLTFWVLRWRTLGPHYLGHA